MSQWLLKKRNKKGSKSALSRKTTSELKPSDAEFREYLSRRQKSSPHQQVTLDTQQQQISKEVDVLESKCKVKANVKDDSIYNEPWDVNCQSLNKEGVCCACMTNRNLSTNYIKSNTQKQKVRKSTNKCKHKKTNNVRLRIEHTEESDTGCETESSNSSDESDCYEFLENIERRLKIDYSKCNPVIMPKWDSDIRECRRNRHHLNSNGYNANCVDEIIYTCSSDNSSGFHETFNPSKTGRNEKQIGSDMPEPSRDAHLQQQSMLSFTSSNELYRMGHKGNRLLGDLIQLNYEKQQLQ